MPVCEAVNAPVPCFERLLSGLGQRGSFYSPLIEHLLPPEGWYSVTVTVRTHAWSGMSLACPGFPLMIPRRFVMPTLLKHQ